MTASASPISEQKLRQLALSHDFAALGGEKMGALQLRLGEGRIDVSSSWPLGELLQPLQQELQQLFTAEGSDLPVSLRWAVPAAPVPPFGADNPRQQVGNLLAVSSAKGGVGKSTLAVNLALALSQAGGRVGLLDGDIYGPNVPRLLGLKAQPPGSTEVEGRQMFQPLAHEGLCVLSMAMLAADHKAMIWRGPMVSSALKQMLLQTLWGELDYLIVDTPPGTGDIPLTLAQTVPVSGALLVSTPDPLARDDTARGFEMFDKLKLPVLGLVENMAWWECSQCSHRHSLFAESDSDRLAAAKDLPLLDSLPLMPPTADGRAHLLADPSTAASQAWRQMSRRIAISLAEHNLGADSTVPRILKISRE